MQLLRETSSGKMAFASEGRAGSFQGGHRGTVTADYPTGPPLGREGGGQVRALAEHPRAFTANLARTPGAWSSPTQVSGCPRYGRGPGPRVAKPAGAWRPSREELSRPSVTQGGGAASLHGLGAQHVCCINGLTGRVVTQTAFGEQWG